MKKIGSIYFLFMISMISPYLVLNSYDNRAMGEEREKKSLIRKLTPDEEWTIFTEAIIWKESRGQEDAVGDNGKAVGVLQIWPIMVDEANRICRIRKNGIEYTEEDRLSREKSIEIFNVVQSFHNKERDFDLALDIWNGNHPESYRRKIMEKYDELKKNALS